MSENDPYQNKRKNEVGMNDTTRQSEQTGQSGGSPTNTGRTQRDTGTNTATTGTDEEETEGEETEEETQ